jgi:multicomponent Na+:H+ antiporter subunit E
MRQVKGVLFLAVVLAAVWLLLTGSVERDELIVGAFVTALSLLVFGRFHVLFGAVKLTPKALLFAPLYLIRFLIELIKSNIDVALRVLNPALPINPGIVRLHTGIKSDLGKLVLANSITLTPGTLTLDAEGEYLYVHWIDVKDSTPEGAQKEISARFEGLLKEIVE